MKTQLPLTKRTLWLLAISSLMTFTTFAQQVINTSIEFDGKTRTYRLYVPQSYDATNPVPLILNYHGFTNTINIQYDQSDFTQLAEDNQFIFVTPQGLGGFFSGWAINNSFGGSQDDLGFSDALIDKIQEDYNINEKRIYATGFSNGGFFSLRMACELSPRIAAVASIAGSMTRSWINNGQCQPQHPTAVLQITGTEDFVIPINGGGSNASIRQVMQYWSDFNNTDNSPNITSLPGGSTRYIWDNGDNGVTAEFIRVQGKGHSWEGGEINTSQEIWSFFSRFDIDGEIVAPPAPCEALDFNDFTINSFANQDNAGDFSISPDGASLTLTNDTWKHIDLDYTVTPDTVIEFEFSSTAEGQLHSIGFENNNSLTAQAYFKLYGTQDYGITNFDDYSGGTTTYVIPVGDFYAGVADRVVFINDNDGGLGNNGTFSNVKIYEGSCGDSQVAQNTRVYSPTMILGIEDEVSAFTSEVYPNPTSDQFSLQVNAQSAKELRVSIYTMLGQRKFEGRLTDGLNNFSAQNLGLSPGVYVIKIQSDGESGISKKLIIK